MEKHQLQQVLEQLHSELERTKSLDSDEQALLRHVKQDVEALLARSGETDGSHEHSLGDRLREGIAVFEVSHPTLTAAMQKVLDGLSQSGI